MDYSVFILGTLEITGKRFLGAGVGEPDPSLVLCTAYPATSGAGNEMVHTGGEKKTGSDQFSSIKCISRLVVVCSGRGREGE